MSLHDFTTSRQLIRQFFSQESALRNLEKTGRYPKTPPTKNDFTTELAQIKAEYETLKRRNAEELEIIQNIKDKGPNLGAMFNKNGRETNFQILINNGFSGNVDSNNTELSFMKEFFAITETYKSETEKLAEKAERLRKERDELREKLKYKIPNVFLKELQESHENLKLKLTETNKHVERDIRRFIIEAETEKKRYLGSLKKLIEIFQIEKLRIEETFSSFSADIIAEQNRHFQDVSRLKRIIEDLTEENEKNRLLFYTGPGRQSKSSFQVFQEIEEYKKYASELELVIRNLGYDLQNMEHEVTDLKNQHKAERLAIKSDAENAKLQLQEEIEKLQTKYRNLQETQNENQSVLEENEALKINLKNIQNKATWKIQSLTKDFKEKTQYLRTQIENHTQTIEKLNNELSQLQGTITNLENQLLQKTGEIETLEGQKSNLETEKTNLQTEFEKAQASFSEKLAQNQENSSKVQSFHEAETLSLKNEISRLEKERKDYQTKMIEHETLYKILKVDYDELVFEKNNFLEKYNTEKETLVKSFQKDIQQLNLQIQEMKEVIFNYEREEGDLHKQIQTLVYNINELNTEHEEELKGLKSEVMKQVELEVQNLKATSETLEKQVLSTKKANSTLKFDLNNKEQRCQCLEEELKTLKTSHQEIKNLLEDSKEHYENDILQLKLQNERTLKRSKDEIERLRKELEQQSNFCDQLGLRKRELERLNTKFSDNLEQVTKVYEREVNGLKNDLENAKTFYENKLTYVKNEASFEGRKYENKIQELEQQVKMLNMELSWLREGKK